MAKSTLPKIIKTPEAVSSAPFHFRQMSEEDLAGDFYENVVTHESDTLDGLDDDFQHAMNGSSPVDAQAVLEKANRDASRIIKQAREKALAVEKEAYEKGLEEGRKSGELIAQQQITPVLGRFQVSLAQLATARDTVINQMQLDLLDLVLTAAEKVIKHELETHPQAILPIIREALNSLKQKDGLRIFLSPEDYQYLSQNHADVWQSWLGPKGALEEDPSLKRGGIRVRTSSGDLDGRLETQFEHIRAQIEKELAND